MKRAGYQYSESAKRDLRDIRAYLKRNASDAVAGRMITRLKDAVAKIREMPKAGVPRPEFQQTCRFVVEDPYMLYYTFDGRVVLILRIVHKARDRDAIMGGS